MIHSNRDCAATLVDALKNLKQGVSAIDIYGGNPPPHMEERIERNLKAVYECMEYMHEKFGNKEQER